MPSDCIYGLVFLFWRLKLSASLYYLFSFWSTGNPLPYCDRCSRHDRQRAVPPCRSNYGDLTVHSEAELAAALAAIDHRLHHETVPLAVEKRLIADHKKLTQQRERVRGDLS